MVSPHEIVRALTHARAELWHLDGMILHAAKVLSDEDLAYMSGMVTVLLAGLDSALEFTQHLVEPRPDQEDVPTLPQPPYP